MKRLIPGLIMTTLWVLLLLYGPAMLFWLVTFAIAGYGLLEYFRMTTTPPSAGMLAAKIAIGILPVAAAVSARSDVVMAAVFASLFALVLLTLNRSEGIDSALAFLGSGTLGVLFIGFCLAHLALLRFLPQGAGWLLVLTAITAGGDTGAYYVGSTLGRHKLCPRISPKKTVEGAVGGVTVGILCAVAAGRLFLPQTSPYLIGLAGFVLSIVSIAGDLTESVIKRSAGVKDSGRLLFGHGGVLDRVDSLLLAGPTLYYFLLLASHLE